MAITKSGSYNPQIGDQWLTGLYPYLPPAAPKKPVKETKTKWSVEARALSQSLMREDALAQLKGGLEFDRVNESFDARWGDLTGKSETFALVSTKSWLIRTQGGRRKP